LTQPQNYGAAELQAHPEYLGNLRVYENQCLSNVDVYFVAGAGGSTANRFAYVSGNNTLRTATSSVRDKIAGVFLDAQSEGSYVKLAKRSGRAWVQAAETVTAGQWVTSDDDGKAVLAVSVHRHQFGVLGASVAFSSAISIGTCDDTVDVASQYHSHTMSHTHTYSGNVTINFNTTDVAGDGHAHDLYPIPNPTVTTGINNGDVNTVVTGYSSATYSGTTSAASESYVSGPAAYGGYDATVTVASDLHAHGISGLPTYIRSLGGYDSGGNSFYLGGVLSNTNGSEANVYTTYNDSDVGFKCMVVTGAAAGNLCEVML
jgi:hypothetical protein